MKKSQTNFIDLFFLPTTVYVIYTSVYVCSFLFISISRMVVGKTLRQRKCSRFHPDLPQHKTPKKYIFMYNDALLLHHPSLLFRKRLPISTQFPLFFFFYYNRAFAFSTHTHIHRENSRVQCFGCNCTFVNINVQ